MTTTGIVFEATASSLLLTYYYVEYSSMSNIEKEEFAKTVADSVPRWEQIVGKTFLKVFLNSLLRSRYRW